jgi:hypothetical protein
MDCGILIHQFECQHEPHTVALFHKRSVKTLLHATIELNFLADIADNKVATRFDPLPAEVGEQKLDRGIRMRNAISAVAHNL